MEETDIIAEEEPGRLDFWDLFRKIQFTYTLSTHWKMEINHVIDGYIYVYIRLVLAIHGRKKNILIKKVAIESQFEDARSWNL